MKTDAELRQAEVGQVKVDAVKGRLQSAQRAMGTGDQPGNPAEARQQAPVASGGKEQYQAERKILQAAVSKLSLEPVDQMLVISVNSDGDITNLSMVNKGDPKHQARAAAQKQAMADDMAAGERASSFLEKQAAAGQV